MTRMRVITTGVRIVVVVTAATVAGVRIVVMMISYPYALSKRNNFKPLSDGMVHHVDDGVNDFLMVVVLKNNVVVQNAVKLAEFFLFRFAAIGIKSITRQNRY